MDLGVHMPIFAYGNIVLNLNDWHITLKVKHAKITVS
jgi:hypothetical protein